MTGRSMWLVGAVLFLTMLVPQTGAGAEPTRDEALEALRNAVGFFRDQVAVQGGYVWRYSSDLTFRRGEAIVGPSTIWVQPPGTPTVGDAILTAYQATGERAYLDAAHKTARALVNGQLDSGGWNYRIEFDPADRANFAYRVPPGQSRPIVRIAPDEPGGWDVWRRRDYPGNRTMLDDETTQAALSFLMRVDKALKFQDRSIHEAVGYGLASVMLAQHPIGAWSHNYDRFPLQRPDVNHYPILNASYPDDWSRTWTKDFNGGYVINDEITPDTINTMLDAYKTYDQKKYLDTAIRGGEFLIRAQMPEPQPAWAQQYDRAMHPVWDRQFEPPAITGHESQAVLETLLKLYQATGEERFLEPIPRAVKYLRSSLLADGHLARFYELKTNRPLYFTRDYQLTYDPKDSPTHYGFSFESRLDAIEAAYQRVRDDRSNESALNPETPITMADLATRVGAVIAGLDDRGAWVDPSSKMIESQTFTDNVHLLCRFLQSSK